MFVFFKTNIKCSNYLVYKSVFSLFGGLTAVMVGLAVAAVVVALTPVTTAVLLPIGLEGLLP